MNRIFASETTKFLLFLFFCVPSALAAKRDCPALYSLIMIDKLQMETKSPEFQHAHVDYSGKKQLKRWNEITKDWQPLEHNIEKIIEENKIGKPYSDYLRFGLKISEDKQRIGAWFLHFKNEVLKTMIAAKDKKALKKYRATLELPDKYVRETVRRLGKAHRFHSVVDLKIDKEKLKKPNGSNFDFFDYIANGSLIIDSIKSNHGQYTHPLQVLFMADMLDAKFGPGSMKKWYVHMGKDRPGGKEMWDKFFDSFGPPKFNRPEQFGPDYKELIHPEQH